MARWKKRGGNSRTSKGMERSFKCTYCGKDYASKDAFKGHEKLCKDRSEKQ